MQVKSEKGVTLILLVITVIVLAILATVAIGEIGEVMNHVNLETVSTDLLLVQAKAKVIAEKANFNDDESLLKGQKVSEVTGNTQIDELKTNGVISKSDENYEKYYIWDKQTVEEIEIGITDMKDTDFFIVNYETEEVIYPQGYEHTDGNTYYKLSEIMELE